MAKYDLDQITHDDILNGKMLLIDKPLKWTSFDVVKYIRKSLVSKFKIKRIKVGHAGTLDPLATGLLIICTGKMTKKISSFQNQTKKYTGTFLIGSTTPSFDLETKPDKSFPVDHINKDLIINATKSFIGKIKQKPPIYSAIKKDGKRKKYDCIVGVSGGTDSSFMIIKAVEWGLRPLAVHYDNTWNTAIATENIRKVLQHWNVDLYTHVVDNKESDDIFKSFSRGPSATTCLRC